MHRIAAAALLAMIPLVAFAQTGPASRQQGTITRDQFIQRGSEIAARRFDAIDTGHTGVITREQMRAFRQAHGRMGRQEQPPNQ